MNLEKERKLKIIIINQDGRAVASYLDDFPGKSFIDDKTSNPNNDPRYHDEFIINSIIENFKVPKKVLNKIKSVRSAELRKVLQDAGFVLFYDWTNYDTYKPGDERNALLFLTSNMTDNQKHTLLKLYGKLKNYTPIRTSCEFLNSKQLEHFPYSSAIYFDDLVELFKNEALDKSIQKR